MKSWRTESSKVVYENPWISVREDTVVRPDGNSGIYGVMSAKNPGVFVVPFDGDGNTYLVRQERYTTGTTSLEVVGGSTDGEPFDIAAKRELLEESGLRAGTITKVLDSYQLIGLSDHSGTICLATDLEKVSDDLDEVDGILSVHKVPLDDVPDMILSGNIIDGISISALLVVQAYLKNTGTITQ